MASNSSATLFTQVGVPKEHHYQKKKKGIHHLYFCSQCQTAAEDFITCSDVLPHLRKSMFKNEKKTSKKTDLRRKTQRSERRQASVWSTVTGSIESITFFLPSSSSSLKLLNLIATLFQVHGSEVGGRIAQSISAVTYQFYSRGHWKKGASISVTPGCCCCLLLLVFFLPLRYT